MDVTRHWRERYMKALSHSTLSREGRDTLWLLAVLTLSIAPHTMRLPLWCTLGTAAAILWRARVAWTDGALPPRVWLLISLAACLAMTVFTFHSLFGREAGITMVTLLAALKTLELRARRDAFVITSLGFFLILTQFLYSQSLPMAVLMFLVLLGLLTSLVLVQRPTGRPTIWSAVKVASRSVLMGIPVMVALFVLFPRLGPLWSVPADAGQHTGLSDKIKLGNVAELAQDDSVAMRIRFVNAPPMARDLYFRGPVLDLFDGRTWQSQSSAGIAMAVAREPAPMKTEPPAEVGVLYQITIEPSRVSVVPLLEGTLYATPTPPATEPQLRRDGMDWISTTPLTERTQLDAQAWPRIRRDAVQMGPPLQTSLQLPQGFNPRTIEWARTLRTRADMLEADPRALSDQVLQHIRHDRFTYTLSPAGDGLTQSGEPEINLIDQFWMDRKTGFCEHFATAYVVVMRAMGIPSRVITGYQGAELSPVDGMFVVRNSDAHAWAEFWQPGEGWIRVDPTAAVAPERIERARPSYGSRNPLPGPLSKINPAVWGRLRDYMEAGNHRWNVWVLQYSRNKQMDMLKNWGVASPNWLDLVRLCGTVLISISLLGIGWLWWTRPKIRRTPWRKPLQRVHRAMLAAGLPAPASSPAPAPALSWIQSLQNTRIGPGQTALVPQLKEALTQLDALRYAAHSTSKQEAQHVRKQLVQRIEQLAQQWRAARRQDRAN
jgi:transglutaminase-like putative cysteine protease